MKCKKLFSAFLAAVVTTVTVLPGTGTLQANAAAAPSPLKTFSFENDLDGSTMQTYQNAGTYTGEAVYEDGKAGKAIRLGDYGLKLNLGNVGENYSVSLWVNPSEALKEHGALLFASAPKGASELWTSLSGNNSGKLKLWSNGDGFGWSQAFTDVTLENNQWSLVTYTQSGKNAALYINGTQVASGTAARALMADGNDLYIGTTHWDAMYKGLVDEVQVYDQALTADDVYSLYDTRDAEEIFAEAGFTVNESISTYTGLTTKLTVVLPAGVDSSDAAVTYVSDNTAIATVDDNGIVTGIAAGTTAITTKVLVGSTEKTQKTTVTVIDSSDVSNLPVVASYTMDNGSGAVITDDSGKGNDATIVNPGNTAYVKDGDRSVLQMNSTDSYITLPSGIYTSLSDKEAFTIEAKYARMPQSASTAWLFCFGSKAAGTGSNYLFYSPFFYDSGIRAGIKDSSTEQLYTASRHLDTDTYYTVSMVFDHGTITLYVDGIPVGPSLESGMNMESIVNAGTENNILGFIGKSCWSADANLLGKIDSFKVYDKALTEDEIQVSDPDHAKALRSALDAALSEEVILGSKNASLDEICYNMNLVAKLNDLNITWISSNPEIISASGKVVNPAEDTQVTLTARVSYGQLSAEKTFTVTVKPLDLSILEAVLAEAKALDLNAFQTESTAALKKILEGLPEDPTSEIKTQEDALALEDQIRNAVSKLVYLPEYKDPWDLIEAAAPKEDASYNAGDSEVLFTIPEGLENCVTVTYHSDNENVAAYKDGKVQAIAAGTAILTTTVTAKIDGFSMEYGTCVTVNKKTSDTSFKDVPESSWFYPYVKYVADNKIMTGLTPEIFGPEKALYRSEMAVIVHRMAGEPSADFEAIYPDVEADEFYSEAVIWASGKDVDVIRGYAHGAFGPADALTREQMVTILYRYANYKGYNTTDTSDMKQFPDSDNVSEFAKPAMAWAVANGLITGSDGKLKPQDAASRLECAVVVQRFMETIK